MSESTPSGPPALSDTNEAALPALPHLALGHYRHYKGLDYEVLGVVRHSESLAPMVLYRPLYNATGMWVRPFEMFVEEVSIDGQCVRRFSPL